MFSNERERGLLQIRFNVAQGKPIEFDNGIQSTKFKVRWLLTRHDINVTSEELLKINSLDLL